MKQYLLAGCAAVALAGISGTAAAQSPGKFDVNIGGDAWFIGAYSHEGNAPNTRSTEFLNRFRLVITPTAKADNGLQYGARLRIRANRGTAAVDYDRAYVFVSGNFGTFQAGNVASPNYDYYVIAPNGFGTGGIDGDWTNASGAGLITGQNTFLEPYFGGGLGVVTEYNSSKINYFTPRFFGNGSENSGLMAMASYTPVQNSFGSAVDRARYAGTIGSQNNWGNAADIAEVGLRYDGEFSGVTVAGSFGYQFGETRSAAVGANFHDLDAYQVGLQLGYAGVTVGGSFLDAGKSGYTKAVGNMLEDQYTWTAGISYETGPVIVGFNYQYGHDAGSTTVAGAQTGELWSIGAAYTIAPGLTTGLEYLNSTVKRETGVIASPNGDADVVLWKTQVAF
jgi:hypothetical protein